MGYNTRRVSLSLPSLGIHLPGTHAASRAAHHRASASSTAASTPSAGVQKSSSASSDSPPSKRVKRSHTLTSVPAALSRASLPSRPRKSASISAQPAQRLQQQDQNHDQKQSQTKSQQQQQHEQQGKEQPQRPTLLGTPPPSPRTHDSVKLDTQGINDDIVVAVLEQLETTGNRPHLIKELVAVLITTLSSVESSQNPTAIISSRLTNYLKRPWTALAPCPLAKEQVTVHPRRVYYFLTTMPRQEIPEYADAPMINRHIISPSISSGPDEDEEMQLRMTYERSPSPEVDFSSSEDPHSMTGMSFGVDTFGDAQSDANHLSRNTRLASPPLELDEREFTQTASVMQLRKQSEQAEQKHQQLIQEQLEQTIQEEPASQADADNTFDTTFQASFESAREHAGEEDDSAEATALRNQEAAVLLFGQSHHHLLEPSNLSSPLMHPQQPNLSALSIVTSTPRKSSSVFDGGICGADMDVDDSTMFDGYGAWGDLKSPEHVELAELDDMFGGY